MIIELTVILIFLIISGAVSGSETAFFSYKQNKTDRLPYFTNLISKPYKLLLLILIINVFVNIGFSSIFERFVNKNLGFNKILSFFIITIFLLLFGEIIPKAIAINIPEIFIKVMSPIFKFLDYPTSKLMKLFSFLENFFINIKGIIEPHKINKDSLNNLLEYILTNQNIEEKNSKILTSLFNLDNIMCKNMMDDFSNIPSIIDDESLNNLKKGVLPFILTRDKKGEINNFITMRDDKISTITENDTILSQKTVFFALQKMLTMGASILIIVDEYGIYQGFITTNRVLSFFFNNLNSGIEKIFIHNFTIEASITINDLNTLYGLKLTSGNYSTLNGFILYNLGRIPKKLESFFIDGVKFTILKCEKNILKEIKIEQGD